jgi:molecular chaperone IbpA
MEDLVMRTTYDVAPFWRSTVGFDGLFDLADAAQQSAPTDDNYPPCNVERLGDDRYRISLAVAGSSPDEIAVTAEQGLLTVEGRKADKPQPEILYRSISWQPFTALQPSRLRPGQGCGLRRRPAEDRIGA